MGCRYIAYIAYLWLMFVIGLLLKWLIKGLNIVHTWLNNLFSYDSFMACMEAVYKQEQYVGGAPSGAGPPGEPPLRAGPPGQAPPGGGRRSSLWRIFSWRRSFWRSFFWRNMDVGWLRGRTGPWDYHQWKWLSFTLSDCLRQSIVLWKGMLSHEHQRPF